MVQSILTFEFATGSIPVPSALTVCDNQLHRKPIPFVLLGESSSWPSPSLTNGGLLSFSVNRLGGFFRKMGKVASVRFPSPMHEAFGSDLRNLALSSHSRVQFMNRRIVALHFGFVAFSTRKMSRLCKRAIFTAASYASKAVEFMHGLSFFYLARRLGRLECKFWSHLNCEAEIGPNFIYLCTSIGHYTEFWLNFSKSRT
jgi:hypothetical protein